MITASQEVNTGTPGTVTGEARIVGAVESWTSGEEDGAGRQLAGVWQVQQVEARLKELDDGTWKLRYQVL